MATKPETHDVAIVGCGPVGAVLANLLRRYGHTVAIFDKYENVFPTPRAGGLDDDTMRVLQAFGIVDRLWEEGHLRDFLISFYDQDEQLLYSFDRLRLGDLMDGHGGHRKMVGFHQTELEKILREPFASDDGIGMYLGYEVQEVEDLGTHAVVKAKNVGTGVEEIVSAQYVVGCDGANSLVQQALGVDLVDLDYSERYIVVDAVCEDQEYLDLRFPDGAYFTMHPQYAGVTGKAPHGWVRFDFRQFADENGEFDESPEYLESVTRDLIETRGYDPDKFDVKRHAPYVFYARSPSRWVAGRLLVAGDAAHLTPPWSGQGLNMGIRDAANIAFKLDLVLNGKARNGLMSTYDSERRPVSMETIKASVATGKLMEASAPWQTKLRDRALALTGKSQRLSRAAFKMWQHKPPYRAGLVGPNHKLAGTSMMQPTVTDAAGNRVMLDDMIGMNFGLITTRTATGPNVERLVQDLGGVVLRLDQDFADADGRLAEWMRKQKVDAILVRPDRYIFDAGSDGEELCRSFFGQLDALTDLAVSPAATLAASHDVATQVLDASPEAVWAVIDDFPNIADWHTPVKGSTQTTEGQATGLGAERTVDLGGGQRTHERISEYIDGERLTVEMYAAEVIPLRNSTMTFTLASVGSNGDKTALTVDTWVDLKGPGGVAKRLRPVLVKDMARRAGILFEEVEAEANRRIEANGSGA